MRRRSAVPVLLVLLVVLAGCLGGGGPDTPAAGDGDSDGGDGLDVVDSEAVLREAGSFTTSWTFTMVDADGNETMMSNRFAVDLAANRTSEVLSVTGESGVSYERFTADG